MNQGHWRSQQMFIQFKAKRSFSSHQRLLIASIDLRRFEFARGALPSNRIISASSAPTADARRVALVILIGFQLINAGKTRLAQAIVNHFYLNQ